MLSVVYAFSQRSFRLLLMFDGGKQNTLTAREFDTMGLQSFGMMDR